MFCEVQDPLGRVYNKSRKPSDFKDSKEQQVKKIDSIQEKKTLHTLLLNEHSS